MKGRRFLSGHAAMKGVEGPHRVRVGRHSAEEKDAQGLADVGPLDGGWKTLTAPIVKLASVAGGGGPNTKLWFKCNQIRGGC